MKQNGFTLLEMLVSVGIIGLLSVVITQAIANTARSNTKTELLKEAKQNGDFVVDVVSRQIRNSAGVTSVCSTTGTTLTSLDIVNSDTLTTTFGCLLDNGVTRIASTSAGRTDYLTSGNVTTGGNDCTGSSLQFICTSGADQATSIQMKFRLSQKGTPPSVFEQGAASFQTTVTTRN